MHYLYSTIFQMAFDSWKFQHRWYEHTCELSRNLSPKSKQTCYSVVQANVDSASKWPLFRSSESKLWRTGSNGSLACMQQSSLDPWDKLFLAFPRTPHQVYIRESILRRHGFETDCKLLLFYLRYVFTLCFGLHYEIYILKWSLKTWKSIFCSIIKVIF